MTNLLQSSCIMLNKILSSYKTLMQTSNDSINYPDLLSNFKSTKISLGEVLCTLNAITIVMRLTLFCQHEKDSANYK